MDLRIFDDKGTVVSAVSRGSDYSVVLVASIYEREALLHRLDPH